MSTRAGNPFDAHPIADFETSVFTAWTQLGNLAHAFVTTYLTGLSGEWKQGPLHGLALGCYFHWEPGAVIRSWS